MGSTTLDINYNSDQISKYFNRVYYNETDAFYLIQSLHFYANVNSNGYRPSISDILLNIGLDTNIYRGFANFIIGNSYSLSISGSYVSIEIGDSTLMPNNKWKTWAITYPNIIDWNAYASGSPLYILPFEATEEYWLKSDTMQKIKNFSSFHPYVFDSGALVEFIERTTPIEMGIPSPPNNPGPNYIGSKTFKFAWFTINSRLFVSFGDNKPYTGLFPGNLTQLSQYIHDPPPPPNAVIGLPFENTNLMILGNRTYLTSTASLFGYGGGGNNTHLNLFRKGQYRPANNESLGLLGGATDWQGDFIVMPYTVRVRSFNLYHNNDPEHFDYNKEFNNHSIIPEFVETYCKHPITQEDIITVYPSSLLERYIQPKYGLFDLFGDDYLAGVARLSPSTVTNRGLWADGSNNKYIFNISTLNRGIYGGLSAVVRVGEFSIINAFNSGLLHDAANWDEYVGEDQILYPYNPAYKRHYIYLQNYGPNPDRTKWYKITTPQVFTVADIFNVRPDDNRHRIFGSIPANRRIYSANGELPTGVYIWGIVPTNFSSPGIDSIPKYMHTRNNALYNGVNLIYYSGVFPNRLVLGI